MSGHRVEGGAGTCPTRLVGQVPLPSEPESSCLLYCKMPVVTIIAIGVVRTVSAGSANSDVLAIYSIELPPHSCWLLVQSLFCFIIQF